MRLILGNSLMIKFDIAIEQRNDIFNFSGNYTVCISVMFYGWVKIFIFIRTPTYGEKTDKTRVILHNKFKRSKYIFFMSV